MSSPTSARETLVVSAHGMVGWALCGVTMGIGMGTMPLDSALIVHAVAAPLIFAALTLAYFHRFGLWRPFKVATVFLVVVMAFDFFVVALLIERSLDMFRSSVGTWLPFLLIFLSSWLTGRLVRRQPR